MFAVVLMASICVTTTTLNQICSHTLVATEQNCELIEFLEWYVKLGHGPNLSSVALSGLPKDRRQKGGQPKR